MWVVSCASEGYGGLRRVMVESWLPSLPDISLHKWSIALWCSPDQIDSLASGNLILYISPNKPYQDQDPPTYICPLKNDLLKWGRMTQWNKNLELRAVLCEMWELNIISLRRIIYCIYTLHLLLWTWHVILQSDTDSLLWQPSGAKLPTNSLLFN